METVRDVLIVVLFFESLVVITLLIILVWQISSLVRLLQREVMPILDTARRTTTTVQGTANFVSTTTVMPLIRVASATAAANRFVRAFLGLTGSR